MRMLSLEQVLVKGSDWPKEALAVAAAAGMQPADHLF